MRLRVLGCSGTYPRADCPSSGYVVESDNARIWVDAGTGTFSELQRCLDYKSIDAIVLSHIHSDHCLDLFPLYYARRFDPSADVIPLFCPEGTIEHMARLLICDTACTLDMIFDYHEVDEGDEIEIGDARVEFMRTQHPVPTNAVRVSGGGQVLAFSSDTGPDAGIDHFAAGSDLFLCEATYQNGNMGAPLHLSAAEAAEFAKRADVGSLLLTHLFPTLDPVRSIAEAKEVAGEIPIDAAFCGGVYDLAAKAWVET